MPSKEKTAEEKIDAISRATDLGCDMVRTVFQDDDEGLRDMFKRVSENAHVGIAGGLGAIASVFMAVAGLTSPSPVGQGIIAPLCAMSAALCVVAFTLAISGKQTHAQEIQTRFLAQKTQAALPALAAPAA